MAAKDILFTCTILDRTPWVMGDPHRLRQCLINLLSNAGKFTDSGGKVALIVSCDAEEQYARYTFSVEDTGIGMSEDQMARIFTAFEQADVSTTRKYGGSGLGLSISDKLIRCMNQQSGGPHDGLQVESSPGHGSRFFFTIRFPLAPERNINQCPAEKPVISTTAGSSSMRKVLLAEDNATNRRIATRLLRLLHCDVIAAKDGSEALQRYQECPNVDMVLMDLHMPVMDGYEATRKLRDQGYVGVIVAQTADAFLAESSLRPLGFDDYLSKPFTLDQLKGLISRHS